MGRDTRPRPPAFEPARKGEPRDKSRAVTDLVDAFLEELSKTVDKETQKP